MKLTHKDLLSIHDLTADEVVHILDVAEKLKTVLDIMALHKLNYLHWHLTDDQGWRLEINAYPQLTKVGSMRRRTIIGKDPNGEYDENTPFDETPYGGYYTQDQVREIVEYAAQRRSSYRNADSPRAFQRQA